DIDAALRDALAVKRRVVQRQERPELTKAASLHDVGQRVARRHVVCDEDRSADLDVLSELTEVASGRTNLDMAVACTAVSKNGERLARHFFLLFAQRRQRVRERREKRFDRREAGLDLRVYL